MEGIFTFLTQVNHIVGLCAIETACDFKDPVGSDEPETSDDFNGPEGMRLDVVKPVVERTGISVLELW